MLLVLDPATSEQKRKNMEGQGHLDFHTKVFEKIDRLSKLHLIVCPHSPTHYDESVVSLHNFKKLKRLYELLSHGISFLRSDQVRNIQIINKAGQYCGNATDAVMGISRDQVLRGNPNAWRDWIRISLNCRMLEGLTEELIETKILKHKQFGEVPF